MTIMTQFSKLAPKNKDLAKENLVDYVNACNKVSAYSFAFTKSNLSPLSIPPAGYSDFVQQFGHAKGNAMEWSNSIIPNMIAIPQAIVDSNRIVQAKFNNILSDLADLAKHPNDKDDLEDIKSNLESILTRAQGEYDSTVSLIGNFDSYSSTLESDYKILSDGLDKLNNATETDQAEVKRLTDEISALNDEINKLNQYLTAAEVGLGVSIFIAAVGIVVGVATGGAGFILTAAGVVGIGGSIAGIVLANAQIHADQKKIGEDTSKMNDYNKDLLVLNVETLSLKNLVQANQDARQALVIVSNVWKDLCEGTKNLIDILHHAESDVATNINQATDEIKQAQADWNDIEKFAALLVNVDYNFDPNVHQLG
ncbi:HBL/NHE enterotoxin family protein [Tumebacillus permanentifrigoris]|uniref:Hemolytic enterotoxin HBL n=1 Tax=Tumebacillus permanentifrigoris TaxID=378543 RepID=A0A316D734_9BACL|nr:HBL/NHE enterotoxin family protein [Tumebacillus permanentifrigoris]PWK11266.1 hemolytic enterotoxin HBL [Tumebacillus permanentifrigoris]